MTDKFIKYVKPMMDEINNRFTINQNPKVVIISESLMSVWLDHVLRYPKTANTLFEFDDQTSRITNFIGIIVRSSGDLENFNFELY